MSTIIDRMFDLMEWYFGKYTDLNPPQPAAFYRVRPRSAP